MTLPPFAATTHRIQPTEESWLEHTPGWLADASAHFDALTTELVWAQECLPHFRSWQPRLTAVCGRSMDPATNYRAARPDEPWTPSAERIRNLVAEAVPGWQPNGLIANLYRDGRDGVDWHADDEAALGFEPVVVSVSLGATRLFKLRRGKKGRSLAKVKLAHGDLLVMGGACQVQLQHSIAKVVPVTGPRISLTFRQYLQV
jgi:hypothetical protein